MPRSPDKRWPSPSEREDRRRVLPYQSSSTRYESANPRYGYRREDRFDRTDPDDRPRRDWVRPLPVERRDVPRRDFDELPGKSSRDSSTRPSNVASTSALLTSSSKSAFLSSTQNDEEGYSTEEGMITPKKPKFKELKDVEMTSPEPASNGGPSRLPSDSQESPAANPEATPRVAVSPERNVRGKSRPRSPSPSRRARVDDRYPSSAERDHLSNGHDTSTPRYSRYDSRFDDHTRGGYRGRGRGRGRGFSRYTNGTNNSRYRSRSRSRSRGKSRSRSRSRSRSPFRRERSRSPVRYQQPATRATSISPRSRSSSRSRSRSRSTSPRKIPTAPKGPRSFNPPTGPSNRGSLNGYVPRGTYRGRGHPRGAYSNPTWTPRSGMPPAAPASDRGQTRQPPLGPAGDRERVPPAGPSALYSSPLAPKAATLPDSVKEPVIGKWAARKALAAAENASEMDKEKNTSGTSPVKEHGRERTALVLGEPKSAPVAPSVAIPLSHNQGSDQVRQEVKISLVTPTDRPGSERRPTQSHMTDSRLISSPLTEMGAKTPVGFASSPAAQRPMTPFDGPQQTKNSQSQSGHQHQSVQISRPPSGQGFPFPSPFTQQQSGGHANSSIQTSANNLSVSHQQQQQQQQMQMQPPQFRTRPSRHVDRTWKSYPAPREMLPPSTTVEEYVLPLGDESDMQVDGTEGQIRIRTREALSGVDALDLELCKLRYERDLQHHAFQAQSASLRWTRFDVTLAEEELDAAKRKVSAAGMMFVNPESLGAMSPLPSKDKMMEDTS